MVSWPNALLSDIWMPLSISRLIDKATNSFKFDAIPSNVFKRSVRFASSQFSYSINIPTIFVHVPKAMSFILQTFTGPMWRSNHAEIGISDSCLIVSTHFSVSRLTSLSARGSVGTLLDGARSHTGCDSLESVKRYAVELLISVKRLVVNPGGNLVPRGAHGHP